VLYALKLATEFLKEGGIFITKIFRSSDYNSLIYVLKQLFKKVEATKPQASRSESAEIFVVCQGYKAPSFIDNKLLDPKFALKQLEDEEEMKMNSIKSIKAMFDRKNNRQGYSGKLYNEKTFSNFVECSNPYQFLIENNKIIVSTDNCKKYLNAMRPPFDYSLYFEDIQLLGKKEIQELIIWRNKIRSKVFKKEKKEVEETEPVEEENYEEKKLEELDVELKQISKQKKKKIENEKRKKEKNELRMKMSFIKEAENPTEEGVEFDRKLFQFLVKNKIDIESLDYVDLDNEKEIKIPKQEVNEIELSDISDDEYVEMMNEDIEQNIRLFNETKKDTKKLEKKENKKKKQRLNEEIKKPFDDGIIYEKNNDNDDEIEDNENEDKNEENENVDEDGYENEYKNDSILDDSKDDEEEEFDNPLRKKDFSKTKKNSIDEVKEQIKKEENDQEDNLSSDTDEEDNKNKLLGKKTKRKNKNNTEEEIQTVPRKNSNSEESEEYDTDEIAEIRAIAKKMLRKKDRLNILYNTYNRYAFNDLDNAPDWFKEDETKHTQPNKPVTKEEINREKEILKKLNDRMPKKILQAKARKRNKLMKRLDKVKKKAQTISNQEEISEVSKIKQIERLYKREMDKSKEKKKYIVSRSFKVKKGKNSRNVRFVDKRLKKDKRAQKTRDKKQKNKRR
jgi:AdoMet-dependent rRNA methyltransferase SPB1